MIDLKPVSPGPQRCRTCELDRCATGLSPSLVLKNLPVAYQFLTEQNPNTFAWRSKPALFAHCLLFSLYSSVSLPRTSSGHTQQHPVVKHRGVVSLCYYCSLCRKAGLHLAQQPTPSPPLGKTPPWRRTHRWSSLDPGSMLSLSQHRGCVPPNLPHILVIFKPQKE